MSSGENDVTMKQDAINGSKSSFVNQKVMI